MNLYEILEAVKALPAGDYAECGVWKGVTAKVIYDNRATDAALWLFDSFKGHAEPGEFDDAAKHPKGRYADTSIKEVRALAPLAFIIPGFLPQTLDVAKDHKFRFVHIDLDHYLPTKGACEFFKARMVKGGIIRFDDYQHGETPGATKAIEEVFGRENIWESDYRWLANQ